MRLIHFSDIHAAPRLDSWRACLDKRALGFFNYQLRRRRLMLWSRVEAMIERLADLHPDIVVCSGDVSTLGGPDEFARAANALAPLVESPDFEFVYVPGNHDAYVRDPASHQSLQDTFTQLNRGRWKLGDLPLVHRVGPLELILVNEGVPAPLLSSHGALDATSRQWLADYLSAPPEPGIQRVLISHFPLFDRHGRSLPKRRACRGIEPLQEGLRNGAIRVALCGHIHHPFARSEPNGGLEICAGSLTQTGTFSRLDYAPESKNFQHAWEQVESRKTHTRKSL